ncbi:MAG TPA: TetR/AcrR family transcriptional regulator [Propionibacteriaceae bacterium]|nr:TetR/AcrR family transcriptional regulator [Propionibacteriaceae bacterium]
MRKGQLTRDAVLNQAARTASEVGLGGVTIGSLADSMHMSKSGLFAHFGSKENLQLATVRHSRDRFVDLVIRPALAAPRGEPRVRALFENWLEWDTSALPGGCLFVAAAAEFDDRPGAVRDELVRNQVDLAETIARIFRGGIAEGHFRPDADPEQFAFDLQCILLGFHQHSRLLGDPLAVQRASRALDALLLAVRS